MPTSTPWGFAIANWTLKLGVVDFVRLAGGDLDPGKALLTGRMDMEGDLAIAARLGEMFGQPPAI